MDEMMRNGNEAIQAALAQMLQNMAALAAQNIMFLSQMAEMRRDSDVQMAGMRREMAGMGRELEEIKIILLKHERILQDLPEALKCTIGFKGK